GIAMALVSFNANIPRYFIEYHLGTAQLGIFAAMAYPMVAGATVVGALGQSATPRLSQYYASGERRAFLSLLLKLVSLASALGLAFATLFQGAVSAGVIVHALKNGGTK